MSDVIIFHFGVFLTFHPHNSPKIKIKKKKMKEAPGDIIILHKLPKLMIICYTVPEIWGVTDVIAMFRFGLFFALLPH